MLALVYLFVVFLLGDAICRRFFSFVSIQHRLATGFLSGLLLSTCLTYIPALIFSRTSQPLIWANLAFLAVAVGSIYLLRKPQIEQPGDGAFGYLIGKAARRFGKSLAAAGGPIKFDSDSRPVGSSKLDWLVLGCCFIFGCWLMYATLGLDDGNFRFANKSWSDFGPHLSLSQSLALGNNYPTEHPFVPGEIIRYHFLVWFQSANLAFLGLNLVWAINLISILSLMSLLVLIMTFCEVLFGSRVPGRLAAILFFLSSSSLSYFPYLSSQPGISEAISSILSRKDFLDSGYPFRGETWGALSVSVYAYQRHLISGIGILLIVLVHLIDLYKRRGSIVNLDAASTDPDSEKQAVGEAAEDEPGIVPAENSRNEIYALILCGALIGALPYWNSAIFVAGSIILASLFVLLPQRRYLAWLVGTVVVLGLPQIYMLRSGKLGPTGHSIFHWGYTIVEPTIPLIFQYIGWTFGFKLLLILMALVFLPKGHRLFFLALSSLLPIVFLLQLSTDTFNNHKLLNVWIIFASAYAAFALWRIGRGKVWRTVLALLLALAMVFGAIIDLLPIRNDSSVVIPHKNDRLTEWIFANTSPNDLFLSDTFISHPILFAGRKVFMGHTLFIWAAGYDLTERDLAYKRMFGERDRDRLLAMLKENKIAYVAIDDGLRRNTIVKQLNETVYQQNFEKVFEDKDRRYGNLTIYRIPAEFDRAPSQAGANAGVALSY